MKTNTFFSTCQDIYLTKTTKEGQDSFCPYQTQLADRDYFWSFVCIIKYNIIKCMFRPVFSTTVYVTDTWVRTKTLQTCKCCNKRDSYVSLVLTL